MSYRDVIPILLVRDMKQTMAFYTEILGFEVVSTIPDCDEPFYCHLQAGGAHLMFHYEAPHTHDDGEEHSHDPSFNGTLYLYPDDVSALYERIKDRVDVVMDLRRTDYGMREFRIVDPNGYEVALGQ